MTLRIQNHWEREALVVHPPVDTHFYRPDASTPREDFFLLAGRLVPYKRPDLAIRAANEAGVRLIVAGNGRFGRYCKAIAGPNVTFLGRVSDAELRDLYRRANALLMPGVEDFGIVPVEAMACGTPVIALADGGALDTVAPGISGQLIAPGTDNEIVDRFAAAIRAFDSGRFDPALIRQHAEGFSQEQFRENIASVLCRL
ncbi:glycosyltransferase family 4 protein [Skermania sp. ID1734]|nr:glycosyltransferase family 4 protein [Skermania sp. ID1734]